LLNYTIITINIFARTIKTKEAKQYFCKGVNNLIKKPVGLLITAVMTFGLTACNNNGDNAGVDNRTARVDRNNTTMNVGNGRNANINNYDYRYNAADGTRGGSSILLGNGRDDGIDHNGPLTEDYSNNDNSDSDIVRDNHRNNDRTGYNVNNRGTNRNGYNVNNRGTTNKNVTNVNNDNRRRNNVTNNQRRDNNVYDRSNSSLYNVYNKQYPNQNRDTGNNNLYQSNIDHDTDIGISADSTTINSKQFPHTRAILIQEAKYKFVPFGSIQWYQYGNRQQAQQPQQGQQPKAEAPIAQAPAPAAPAPTAPAPAPNQAAPAPKTATPAPKAATPAPAPAGEASQFVQQVIDLTNAERRKQGLPALKADTQLNGVAQKKSVDMQQNNYFSHTSPTYGSPFDMMRDFGVTYKSAGENIAQGQRSPQEVVTAWMNSEGHRKNILSGNFTHIGVGYEKAGNHWTQMFIGK
jgi:uncharacterized YkwD family protein